MKKKTAIFATLGACTLLLGGYIIFEREHISKTEYTFESPTVTQAFDGFKICHISDYHNKLFGEDNKRFINKISKENPDVIFVTGDLVDSRHTDIEISLDMISKCVEIAPVYYVSGNHEHSLTETERAYLLSSLEELGVNVLENEAVSIYRKEEKIQIGGFFDKYDESKTDIFDSSNCLKLLLNHRPTRFELFEKTGADLVFSGHAHGGQVVIPFVGGVIAPDQGFFPKYTSGMHRFDSYSLVISRGLGNSLCPIRVNNPPELIFVTLKTGDTTK